MINMIAYLLMSLGESIYQCMYAEYQIQQLFMIQIAMGNSTEFQNQIILNLQTAGLTMLSNIQNLIVYLMAEDWFNVGN